MLERNGNEAVLEIARPDRAPEKVTVTHTPFLIGRGADTGNHLQLEDPRISRRCAAILQADEGYLLEDRGNGHGVWVNGRRISKKILVEGDAIEFGVDDSPRIVFRHRATQLDGALTSLGTLPLPEPASGSGGLSKLNLLLEATSLLHSALPLDSVLGSMLDHAIFITSADRALLLEPDTEGALKVRLARGGGGSVLSPDSVNPSQTALKQAVAKRAAVITDDLNLADLSLKGAQSVVIQGLRSVVAIPLYASANADNENEAPTEEMRLLGVLYLDSRHTSAFSNLDRQILDALSVQAASILDNARHVEREREQRRLEQELSIGREIQQGLLPQGIRDFPHLEVSGIQFPCLEVGGDYFDVFPLSETRTAFLIADVAGKGLGAALVTTMLQGALSGMLLEVSPEKVFNHVNRFLCKHASVGRYATMFFATVDADGTLEYLYGGHPSPLLIRDGQVSDLYTEGSFPVGLVEVAEFEARKVQLKPDDMLVLFTDGIIEADNAKKELFGFERLRDVAGRSARSSIETLQKSVLDAVSDFAHGAAQADDITLLIVKYRQP
jgi:serine phosphatase RsbU (regulator of sigma subunit)